MLVLLASAHKRDRKVRQEILARRDSQEATETKELKVFVVPPGAQVTTGPMVVQETRVAVETQDRMDNVVPRVTVSLDPMETRERKVSVVLRASTAAQASQAVRDLSGSKVSPATKEHADRMASRELEATPETLDNKDSRGLPVITVVTSRDQMASKETKVTQVAQGCPDPMLEADRKERKENEAPMATLAVWATLVTLVSMVPLVSRVHQASKASLETLDLA